MITRLMKGTDLYTWLCWSIFILKVKKKLQKGEKQANQNRGKPGSSDSCSAVRSKRTRQLDLSFPGNMVAWTSRDKLWLQKIFKTQHRTFKSPRRAGDQRRGCSGVRSHRGSCPSQQLHQANLEKTTSYYRASETPSVSASRWRE